MRCFAFTDGSFSKFTKDDGTEVGIYGAGIYLQLENVDSPIEVHFGASDDNLVSMRNVAGELRAVTYLVTCLSEELPNYNDLTIYYDYEGIEKWVTGEWRANKEATRAYRDMMREHQRRMRIRFVKVTAHQGVRHNERADKLAKLGVTEEAAKLGFPVKAM